MRSLGRLLAALLALSSTACAQPPARIADPPQRIVSLDYCADQYVLRFADRDAILALSPDAGERYSYMRAAAEGIATVRPRTADVLALRPDLVVRSYGGGPGIAQFLEGAGVPLVQIGYPQTIDEVRGEVLRIGSALGRPREAKAVVGEMDRRLAALAGNPAPLPSALYMTPAGVTAGPETLVHEILRAAGLTNFEKRPGWHSLPLERLAYERPDLVVAAFFESASSDNWSAARHPIARAQLERLPVVPVEGAWTSCGGWFVVDAIEALASAGDAP